ncbi:flavodoxin domain-containing protein [Lentzea terrae]|uniref:flavodoxin domain-containing protein n=1 Tax=Lentzea terrae TaxID=2200761 RepID=UPI000DD3DDD8|nr:flavodoxin domain-containing protein [Lentzea terrae]
MKVLVAYATAAGSTVGVAQRIAEVLRAHGHVVATSSVDQVTDAENYDAYVVGSAVHDQAWLPSGAAFLSRERRKFVDKPVWLFSVGLPGSLHGPLRKWAGLEEPAILAHLREDVTPVEHRLFSGVVRAEMLGKFGALVFRAVGGRFGDFRDWQAIEQWAATIAGALADIEATAR